MSVQHLHIPEGALLLTLDTCGPTGSVALGRVQGPAVAILQQIELEGRTYSSTLIAAVRELLLAHNAELSALTAIVAVHGPGSFTGVRVCLSAAKGLAEAASLPLAAVSRLGVLAAKAGVASAALDAHRNEVFLRVADSSSCRELLAGREELDALPAPAALAVCDEPAAKLLLSAWPELQLVQTSAPTAADALPLGLERLRNGLAADVALLDGHYLRRSDAEIFGEKGRA